MRSGRVWGGQINGLLLAGMALVSGCSTSGLALQQGKGPASQLYAGAGLLMSHVDPDTRGAAGISVDESRSGGGSLALGYDLNNRFSAEAHVADLGEAGLAPNGSIGYTVAGISGLMYGPLGKGQGLPYGGFSVFGRWGLGTLDNSASGVRYRRVNSVHLLAGLGIEYRVDRRLGVRAELVAHETDAKYVQLGLVYRFGGATVDRSMAETDMVEPGTAEPGTAEPGTVESGTVESGTAEPGTVEPGTVESGTAEPGTAEPGTVEPGTVESGTAEPGTAEPGTVESGTAEPGTVEPGTVEPGTVEPGTAEPGTAGSVTAGSVTVEEPRQTQAIDEAIDSEKAVPAMGELEQIAPGTVFGGEPGSDQDGDGVPDSIDRCTDTTKGSPVAEDGCNLLDGVIAGVDFQPGTDILTEGAIDVLAGVARTLRDYPDIRLAIRTRTDNAEDPAASLLSSRRRAIAVTRYLINEGISGARLRPEAYGGTDPRASNETEEGRAANGSVEMYVIP